MIEAERLRRENVESQLEGLRSQVNPHFLFNSLNTLTYIIPEDPQRAVRFVQMLSKVYRYILEIREKKLITL
ncbi:MAG: histidine kinase [Saprospiraceae bacterium]|nr:histidine kinase [Saprospiraceae bacterium]